MSGSGPAQPRPDLVARGGGIIRGTGAAVRSTAASAASSSMSAFRLGGDPGSSVDAEADQARREIVLLGATVISIARLVEGPPVWLVGAIVAVLVALGARRAVALRSVGSAPPEASLVPAVAAFAGVAALHLVPVGIWLIPAILAAGALIDLSIGLEARIAARPMGFTPFDRSLLLGLSLLVAFVGYSGLGALVPDGLVQPAATPGGPRIPPPLPSLVALAAADATIAFLLGFRFATLRAPLARLALLTAATYAAATAIAAGLLSAAALPRLLGPALLTLVFFLWESFVGAEAPTRRDPRFIWQVVLLAILGVVVVVWNLLLPR